jgi:ribosomal subunit interface protein
MQVVITGIHVDIGEAFSQYVQDAVQSLSTKYKIDFIDGAAQLSKNAYEFYLELRLHLGRNIVLQGKGNGPDAHLAFDNAMHRLEKRLRRHKERLVDYHKNREPLHEAPLSTYVFNSQGAIEEQRHRSGQLAPAVIAEIATTIPTLTVSDAVMRLDLSDEPAMMFENEANGHFNMVYRRSDGNIGWIDPSETKK